MGYTNYWQQPTDFNDKQWSLITKEFEYITDIAGDKIQDTECDDKVIMFNGGKGGSCETFYLEKNKDRKPQYEGQDTDFNFCKTRGMEYDIYVWHMLTFCQMVKEDFKPTKDGWAITDEFVGGNESKETNINNIREVTNV